MPAVTVGAAICVATSMCADMMADLKTGYLVGSKPIKQQIAQIATCWIGPSVALFTVILLWKAYGFGPDQSGVLYARAVEAGPDAVAALVENGGSETTLARGTPSLGAPQAGALQSAVANATIGHLFKKAKAATEGISSDNYRQAAQGKGSVVIPRGELTDVQWSPDRLDLRLRGGGKKHRFQFEGAQAEPAHAFATALTAAR